MTSVSSKETKFFSKFCDKPGVLINKCDDWCLYESQRHGKPVQVVFSKNKMSQMSVGDRMYYNADYMKFHLNTRES